MIFTGGIAVLLLLGRRRGRARDGRCGERRCVTTRSFGSPPSLLLPVRAAVWPLRPSFTAISARAAASRPASSSPAGFILYALIFGLDALRRTLPPELVRVGIALGLLIFAGTGVAGMLLGANYLDYAVLAAEPARGEHYGILIVELGVGITVAAVLIAAFEAFAGRRG